MENGMVQVLQKEILKSQRTGIKSKKKYDLGLNLIDALIDNFNYLIFLANEN